MVAGTPLLTWRKKRNPWKLLGWLTWHLQQWTRGLASNMVDDEDQNPSLSLDFHMWTHGTHTHTCTVTHRHHRTCTQRSYKHTYVYVDHPSVPGAFISISSWIMPLPWLCEYGSVIIFPDRTLRGSERLGHLPGTHRMWELEVNANCSSHSELSVRQLHSAPH